MAEVASAYVTLIPSAKGFGRGIQGQIGGDLDRAGRDGGRRLGRGMSASFMPLAKGMMGPLVGAFAALKAVDFFKESAQSMIRIERLNAQTASAIKATGGAAKVSAKHIADLTGNLENMTGTEAESIQQGANMLLTFTNVKNGVGKGNQIFDQATTAITDMSRAMDTTGGANIDTSKTAIQLGKALNDPVKGITALSKVGVSFTAQQKKSIKSMVESGNTMGAQKVILGELKKEFGGAGAAFAQTTAGKIELAKHALGTFGETIVAGVLPPLAKLATVAATGLNALATKAGPAIGKLQAFLKPAVDTVKLFIGAFTGKGSDVELPWMNTIIDMAGTARGVFDQIVSGVKGVFASFQSGGAGVSTFQAAFTSVATFLRGQVIPAILGIVTAVQGFVSVALPIVKQFVAGMMARIEPMLPAVKSVFTQVGSTVVTALNFIKTVISAVTTVIAFIWDHWGQTIMNYLAATFNNVVSVVRGALNIVQGIIKTVTALIHGDWSGAWEGIKQILSGAWTVIKAVVSQAINIVKTVLGAAWDVIKLAASAAWDGIKAVISAAWGGIKSLVSAAIRVVVGYFLDMAGDILAAAASAFSWVPGIGPKLKEAAAKFDQFKSDVNTALGGIDDKDITVGVKFSTAGKSVVGTDAGDVIGHGRRFATGGAVFGSGTGTSDSIPALLSNGEHVLTAKEVKAAGGHSAIMAWRKNLAKFAKGGAVVKVRRPSAAAVTDATQASFGKFADSQASKLMALDTGNPPGAGVQRWASTIARALSMNGLPSDGAYVNAWLRQVALESGGNPNARQQVHDVNSGPNAARGLLQVIPTTFAPNAFPGHGNIFNGFDNALAAIHYAKGRYGAAGMLGVIGHGHGYAAGTNSATPGLHWVGERGPELVNFRGGEQVLNHHESKRVAAGGAGAGVHIENLHVRDEDALVRKLREKSRDSQVLYNIGGVI